MNFPDTFIIVRKYYKNEKKMFFKWLVLIRSTYMKYNKRYNKIIFYNNCLIQIIQFVFIQMYTLYI